MSYPFASTLAFGVIEPPTIEPTPFEPLHVSTVTDCFGTQHWKGLTLDRIETTDGYIKNDTLSAYYRDFQGNICAIIRGGKLIQATNYYPYGMPIAGGTNPDEQRHKYSGKELLTHYGLNCYDYGPRLYDPALIQFHTPDPLREESPWNHSSLYCSANPIRFSDPTGLYEIEDLVAMLYYALVAIFPANADEDEALSKDLKAARDCGVPRIIVENKQDFINAMNALNEMGISFNAIVFNSHGNNGNGQSYFFIGNEVIHSGSTNYDLRAVLEGKEVVISACNVGKGQSGEMFLLSFAEDTNAIAVYGANQKVREGYKYDGSTNLDWEHNKIPYPIVNSYKMAIPNVGVTEILQLTLDKYKGVNYNASKGEGNKNLLRTYRSIQMPTLKFK